MKRLVIATRNDDKVRELKALLADMDVEILSLADYNPDAPRVIEDGATLEENAIKKATSAFSFTKEVSIADDSGLEVDALGGKPGVLSSRFGGEDATYADNNRKLLQLLRGVPPHKRGARFRCCVAIASQDGKVEVVEGTCEGKIADAPRGKKGFGYDPLFIIPKYNKTFAELPPALKNRISHRAKAMARAKKVLKGIFNRSVFGIDNRTQG